jgi:hypothetical protein
MPRTLLGDEIIESLSSVAAYREVVGAHGDSTTSVASVVGTNTDTVALGTNFGSNDPAYIAGDAGAELNEISAIATNVITWKRKRLYADSIGADPYRGAIGRAQMGGQGLLCIKFTGLRKDGWTVELDAVGCSITGSPTANASGKTARPIPVEGRCLTHVINVYK